jgi:hypothetical protein
LENITYRVLTVHVDLAAVQDATQQMYVALERRQMELNIRRGLLL